MILFLQNIFPKEKMNIICGMNNISRAVTYRHLKLDEVEELKKNGNNSDDWNSGNGYW